MSTNITVSIYQRISGDGRAFKCEVCENGDPLLVFGGGTAEEAEQRARDWINRSFDTPERRARIAELAANRVAAKKRKAAGQ